MSSPLLVCVIDDDPSLCAALQNLLRSYGYRAVAYDSAEEFLASTDAVRADCVISDIQMSGMSGIDLRLSLAGTRPNLPVILMTARTERVLLDRAAAATPFRILRKPFEAQELVDCLTVAMGAEDAARPGLDRP